MSRPARPAPRNRATAHAHRLASPLQTRPAMLPRASLLCLALPALATIAACGDAGPDGDTCGALPAFGCEVDACDPAGGAERDCAAGAALYECVDGAWEEVDACTPDLIVIDGPWQLELAGALIDGCPSLALPALEIEAEHPEGTQQLTLTADDATFDEVSLLVAFDVANVDFDVTTSWGGAAVDGRFELTFHHDDRIVGAAEVSLDDGESSCTVELVVTGTFTAGWYAP